MLRVLAVLAVLREDREDREDEVLWVLRELPVLQEDSEWLLEDSELEV